MMKTELFSSKRWILLIIIFLFTLSLLPVSYASAISATMASRAEIARRKILTGKEDKIEEVKIKEEEIKEICKAIEAKEKKKPRETKRPVPKPELKPREKVAVSEVKVESFDIKDVSVIDGVSRALLIISFNKRIDDIKYKYEVKTKGEKKLLELKLDNTVRTSDKPFKIKSSFIINISIQEDKTENSATIQSQLSPSVITGNISKVENSLVITLLVTR